MMPVHNTVPKFDRALNDLIVEELHSPNFTITTATSGQAPTSPRSGLFAQTKEWDKQYGKDLGVSEQYLSSTSTQELPDVDGAASATTTKKRCYSCNRTDTPEWRDGPSGNGELCNACGLHFRKLERNRQLHQDSMRAKTIKAWSPTDEDLIGAPWYECPGTLNGTMPVNALPDWGSSVNVISEAFAIRHKLRVVPTPAEPIKLLGNNRVESIGRVFASFRFQGERQGYWREFHVLRRSLCDVILGKSFLAETQTLTKFASRIIQRVRLCVRKRDRLFLLDEQPKDQIRCSVNGVIAAALPDTGSDLMLVSGAFVKRHGFKIHRGEEYQREVELVDGSIIWTDGTVLGANLKFDVPFGEEELPSLDREAYIAYTAGLSSSLSKEPGLMTGAAAIFICDLHVIEDLPCDIVLSGDFIFRNNVFTKFQSLFMKTAAAECHGAGMTPQDALLFVRKRPRWLRSRRPGGAAGSPVAAPTTATSWQERWRVEEERRNQVCLWLAGLPEAERIVERARELERRVAWDSGNPRP
ncbi:hypothetical protein QBC47DRAFT_225662 [Echria macrotheca]|uniref:GATA-type domain-containing protein n=1 Tax=Echria macrotheca TaxID=438768 RepID=A0AAJ0BAL7_9PEZI|nr:hypothetical protein QBC47DRAFT_225662 [Echria macrotheca]